MFYNKDISVIEGVFMKKFILLMKIESTASIENLLIPFIILIINSIFLVKNSLNEF